MLKYVLGYNNVIKNIPVNLYVHICLMSNVYVWS